MKYYGERAVSSDFFLLDKREIGELLAGIQLLLYFL
jgi:hypothetical protein